MSKIFQNYQNPCASHLNLEEVRARISDLTTSLRGNESYYRRHQPEVLTKEQREEILLENEIQEEIDFYEHQIEGFRDEEDVKKFVSQIPVSHFNKYDDADDYGEYDEERHYRINDYCDPYLEKSPPSISEFDSEEEPAESKIDVLEKKIDGVQDVVYQLLGGLFNQKTQSNVLDTHSSILLGDKYQPKSNENSRYQGEFSVYPTTRQGDKHEEEIQLLKQQVSKLEDMVLLLIRIIKN